MLSYLKETCILMYKTEIFSDCYDFVTVTVFSICACFEIKAGDRWREEMAQYLNNKNLKIKCLYT